MAEQPNYDRGAEDVGNIVALEHVNVTIPDQRIATLFYIVGLGFTRDPYLMVGDENMWVNIGRQQFHLPTGAPQVLRGHTVLVVPDLKALAERLTAVRSKLAQTRFNFIERGDHLLVNCPWGNQLHCHAPAPRFGDLTLGVAGVEFSVRRGAAAGIARFYEEAFATKAILAPDKASVTIPVGRSQTIVYRENDAPAPPYDGHHIAIYVADFSGPHRFFKRHDLISEESDAHQYRFQDIFDLETGEKLFEIEHEVRSLTHPLYARPLLNRNPAQSNRKYLRGCDAFYG
jgi:hypothetical protein